MQPQFVEWRVFCVLMCKKHSRLLDSSNWSCNWFLCEHFSHLFRDDSTKFLTTCLQGSAKLYSRTYSFICQWKAPNSSSFSVGTIVEAWTYCSWYTAIPNELTACWRSLWLCQMGVCCSAQPWANSLGHISPQCSFGLSMKISCIQF